MRRPEAGSALIEFAGSLIVVVLLFAGIFQFSYSLSSYRALVNAVRAGARYASIQAPPAPRAGAQLARAVQNVVVYGDPQPAPDARPVAPGLTPENVEFIQGPSTVTVALRGFQLAAVFSRINLEGRPSVTFPRTPVNSQ
jgi:uncharacterized iron-regulated membrane protein